MELANPVAPENLKIWRRDSNLIFATCHGSRPQILQSGLEQCPTSSWYWRPPSDHVLLGWGRSGSSSAFHSSATIFSQPCLRWAATWKNFWNHRDSCIKKTHNQLSISHTWAFSELAPNPLLPLLCSASIYDQKDVIEDAKILKIQFFTSIDKILWIHCLSQQFLQPHHQVLHPWLWWKPHAIWPAWHPWRGCSASCPSAGSSARRGLPSSFCINCLSFQWDSYWHFTHLLGSTRNWGCWSLLLQWALYLCHHLWKVHLLSKDNKRWNLSGAVYESVWPTW